ncbi:MAG: UvrD-helicase domain-containing protein [Bacteroidales bacterium]|nr:UvrD-helicase domain-containing protein [Bacteroidales bacterium]
MEDVRAVLEGLNEEQKKAVQCVEGPVLIVAGAGSGKTRVLTSRIAYILAGGVDPSRVLALTFTKKAAGEMKERIALMVGARKARQVVAGTFHAIFVRFLREFCDSIHYPRDFTIYDQSDSVSAVKTCIKELGLDDKVYKPREVLSRISSAKNSLITPKAYKANQNAIINDTHSRKPRICDIYELYDSKLRQSGVMDFDDILLNTNILLRDDKNALQSICDRFSYIMVDEYQDTNSAQYLILRRMAQTHHNICVVGDDSQSIYAFRGARIENILNFQKDYPECKVFRLERNYRSTGNIVNAANSVIARNEGRIPKKCYSVGEDGDRLRILKSYTEQEEAIIIVGDIIGKMRAHSAQYRDFAILYRTNSQSRALEEQLRRRNIPYLIYSGNSFFERAEVKDMMAYFKLVVNPNDDESFKRAVGKPSRGIGDTSVSALNECARAHGCSLFKAAYQQDTELYGLRPAALAKIRAFTDMIDGLAAAAVKGDAHQIALSIADKSGLYAFFKADTSIEGLSRTSNIEELLNSVASFVEEQQEEVAADLAADGREGEPLPVFTLSDFLESASLMSNADTDENEDDASNKVALMTVHSAKGLEFPYVYVAGLEENLFPSGGMLASPADIEEERRLFYVAVTRAEKAVCLSFATTRMRNGKHESNSPSRFIKEIDTQYIENPLDEDDFDSSGVSRDPFGRSGGVFGSRFGGGSGGRFSGSSGAGSRFGGGSGAGSGAGSRYSSEYGQYRLDRGASDRNSGSGSRYGASDRPAFGAPSACSGATPAAGRVGNAPARPGGVPGTGKPALIDPNFVAVPMTELFVGERIEHNRFGGGKILEITGQYPEMKARINFDDYGEKLLLLKYAKLRPEKK